MRRRGRGQVQRLTLLTLHSDFRSKATDCHKVPHHRRVSPQARDLVDVLPHFGDHAELVELVFDFAAGSTNEHADMPGNAVWRVQIRLKHSSVAASRFRSEGSRMVAREVLDAASRSTKQISHARVHC